MNALLQNQILSGIRILQAQTGEVVTLGGVTYPCTYSDLVGGSLDFVQGGVLDLQSVTVAIAKADLSTAPVKNTLAVFWGINLRVDNVSIASLFYNITLIQVDA
jgi:hypothetical protein